MSNILIRGVEMPTGCHDCLLCNRGDELSDDWYCEALHGEKLNAKNKTGIKRTDCPIVEVYDIGKLTIPAEEGAWEQGGRIYSTYKPISMKFPKWKAVSPDTFIGEKTE